MKKTEGATKAHGSMGYWEHLRKFGKRLANKATRRNGKIVAKSQDVPERDGGTNHASPKR